MPEQPSQPDKRPAWALPYSSPQPDQPLRIGRLRLSARGVRIAAYVLLAVALIVPVIQVQHSVMEDIEKVDDWHARREAGKLTERQIAAGPPRGTTGALNRWASHVRGFWAGENIYVEGHEYVRISRSRPAGEERDDGGIRHPNMPFVVILLTPFAYMPHEIAALVWSIAKLLIAIAGGLGAVRFCNHRDHRMGDWVVGLAVLSWILLGISDIQHANTNLLVLGFIGLHLGLYRQGRDISAGVSLAVAVCLKLTPLLLVLYWLYQRNWKLLAGCAVAGVVFAVVIPAALMGPAHYAELTGTWLDNLIFKGVGGAWYPSHVNQSLPGTMGRYLLGGQPGGDYNWAPDDVGAWENMPDYLPHRWIAFASLNPATVHWIVRAMQLAIVALVAWAIGWRKLPRDDGRRGLHVAMVLPAMMLLNQRTWDHHAVVLLPAYLAVWYALAYGRMSRRWRVTALVMTILAGLTLWLSAGELLEGIGRLAGAEDEEEYANHLLAYGPRMYTWLLTYLAAAVLCVALKGKDDPYARERQAVAARAD
jgi:hypothetical protein